MNLLNHIALFIGWLVLGCGALLLAVFMVGLVAMVAEELTKPHGAPPFPPPKDKQP